MTSQIDERGRYVCDLHTLVTFSFGEILGMNLADFNHQNVISGLAMNNTEDGFELTMHPCYGLAGTIRAAAISISFRDGLPEASIYAA
jgi:alpha/beta superfamily hydrolase